MLAVAVEPVPKPADGLWAILDPGCPKPDKANTQAWPKCAQPFWIGHDTAVVVRAHPAKGGGASEQSYRADYRIAAGEPVIAQVGNQHDGYLFLALTELDRDEQGRMIGASGAAFFCRQPTLGRVSLRPSDNGCDAVEPAVVRQAAAETLQDTALLSRMAWIAPGSP